MTLYLNGEARVHEGVPTVQALIQKLGLPEPAILLVVITAVLGALFGAIGGWIRERMSRPAAA